MPKISEFYGIVIYMYYLDHNPPHFHAVYGDYNALIDIENVELITGFLPKKKLNLVLAWCEIHKVDLLLNWEYSKNQEKLFVIDPLH